MTREELEKLEKFVVQGWHCAEMYERGDGILAMTTPRGHPYAPIVRRLLDERDDLREALCGLLAHAEWMDSHLGRSPNADVLRGRATLAESSRP